MPASISRTVGQTFVITPHPLDSNGNPVSLPGHTVTHVSSNETVAPITANGIGTARSVGTAIITTTVDGVSDTTTVTVVAAVASVTITPADTTLPVGTSLDLGFTALDSNGQPVAGATGVWSSSDPTHASVNAATGVVTATGYGTGSATISVVVGGVTATRVLSLVSRVPSLASFDYTPDVDGYVPAVIPSDTTFDIEQFYAEVAEHGGIRLMQPTGILSRAVPGMTISPIPAANNTGGWTWTSCFAAPTDGGADSGPFAGTRAQKMTLDRRAVIGLSPETWGVQATGVQRVISDFVVNATNSQAGKPWVSGLLAIKGVRAADAGKKFRLAIMNNALTTVYAEKVGTLAYDATARGGWALLGVEYRVPSFGTYEVVLEFDQAPEDYGDSAANAQTQVLIWGMGGRLGRLPKTTTQYWAPWSARPLSSADAGVGGAIGNPLPIYPGLGIWTNRQSKNHVLGSDNWFNGNTWRSAGGATTLNAASDYTYGSNIQTGDAEPTAVRFPQNGYVEPWGGASDPRLELKGGWSVDATNGVMNLPGYGVHGQIIVRSYNGGALPADGELAWEIKNPGDGTWLTIPLSRETWWAGDPLYTGRALVPSSWTATDKYQVRVRNTSATQYDLWVMVLGFERDGYNANDENGPRAQPAPTRTSHNQTTGAAAPGSMIKVVPASSILTTRQGAALYRFLLPFDPYTYHDSTWTLQLTDTGAGGQSVYGLNVSFNSIANGAMNLKAYMAPSSNPWRQTSVILPITALGQFPARQQVDVAVLWDSARDGSNNPIASSFAINGFAVGVGAGSSVTWRDDLIVANPTGGTDWDFNGEGTTRICPFTDQDHRLGLCGFGKRVTYVKSVCPSRLDVEAYFASMGPRKSLTTGGVVA